METIEGCRNLEEQRRVEQFVHRFRLVWPEPQTCQRALEVYLDEHLRSNIGILDAMIGQMAAGYRFGDPTILGFSHTHFSGTGHSDLGDVLLMPSVGPVQLAPGTAEDPDSGYRSRYSHASERAEPG